MSGEQTFWTRRRAKVAAEVEAEKLELEAQAHAEEQALLEAKTDEELLAELNLPEPESLGLGDDFTAFMSKAVPERLRRRALRTLWRSNPVLANVDMLVDYGEDFTDSAVVVENLQTAYQVGKGMLKHVEEMARQAEERAHAEEALENPDHEDEQNDLILADADPDETLEDVDQEIYTFEEADDYEDAEVHAPPSPRRMTFKTEELTA